MVHFSRLLFKMELSSLFWIDTPKLSKVHKLTNIAPLTGGYRTLLYYIMPYLIKGLIDGYTIR